MYGYKVPSTGYLKNFIIRPYSPGMLFIHEKQKEIPERPQVWQGAPNWELTKR